MQNLSSPRARALRMRRIFCCPSCKGTLDDAPSSLVCHRCELSYPVADGSLPILLSRESEFHACATAYAEWRADRQSQERLTKYRRKWHFPSTVPYNLTSHARSRVTEAADTEDLILNLGSGRQPRPDERWVHVDVRPHHHCDCVADAHYLPFPDGLFAAATSDNSFEYFADPFRAAEELNRVLKPGGMAYIHVPFALPIGSGDRFRYSGNGIVAVFRKWEVVAVGASAGPFKALARTAELAVETLLPGRVLSFAGAWCTAWLLHPFKYLDPWILRKDRTERSGTSFYLVARKPV